MLVSHLFVCSLRLLESAQYFIPVLITIFYPLSGPSSEVISRWIICLWGWRRKWWCLGHCWWQSKKVVLYTTPC